MRWSGPRSSRRARPDWLAVLAFLFISSPSVGHTQNTTSEIESYRAAVEYCRSNVQEPTTISQDGQIVCFDGPSMDKAVDLSLVRRIRHGGLFVITGYGGDTRSAIAASDVLRERNATVVIYDYCLLSCAEFFFVASSATYVVKDSLVVWQYLLEGCDITFRVMADFDLPKVWRADCPSSKAKDTVSMNTVLEFYHGTGLSSRVVKSDFYPLPDSLFVRKKLISLYGQTGVYPAIGWTLSPHHTRSLFSAQITYEAYPQSQAEATAIANRFRVRDVIYDP